MTAEEVEIKKSPDMSHGILVLAHRGLGGMQLVDLLARRRLEQGSTVFVVVPALSGSFKQLANDDRDEIAAAQNDLHSLLSEIRAAGHAAEGIVGDSDPRLALEDSLRQFAAEEIVVINPPESEMDHLEKTSTERAVKDVSLPVSILHVDSD